MLNLAIKKNTSIAKELTLKGRFFNKVFIKLFAAPFVKTVWVKKISGIEHLPSEGSFIIAANHQSFFDFMGMVVTLPLKLTFLAAEKFYDSPVWRPVMEYTGQIKVERDNRNQSRVIKRGLRLLRNGGVLCVFPQGTRSRDGEIGQTHTGVAMFALTANVPVIPLGIKGTYEILPPHAKRPAFRKLIEFHIGTPLKFDGFKSDGNSPDVYREVTNRIMAEIAHLAGKRYEAE
jgi:1-acyl-sn-glycerol-3-phosphate acyltransferase